jgi:hypothetical protein
MLRGLQMQLVVAKGAENRQGTKHRVVRVVVTRELFWVGIQLVSGVFGDY